MEGKMAEQDSKGDACAATVMREGDFVILKTEKTARMVQLRAEHPVFVDKRKIECTDIIGRPWEQVFAMSGAKGKTNLIVVPRQDYVEHLFSATGKVFSEGQGQDNRSICDENRSQKLSRDKIEQFKKDGASSVAIVQSLVENSESFQAKTGYSQEKYLKKKLKKYDCYLQTCRPTVRSLAHLYWNQSPLKVGMLRPDSLATMLAHANILSSGKYVVMDSYLGLLTAAVLERCPQNQVIQVLDYQGYQSSTRQAVQALGLGTERLLCVDYYLVERMARGEVLRDDCPEDPSKVRKVARFEKNMAALRILHARHVDGLLLNCRGEILESTVLLLQFLKLSRPFVIFSPYLEELARLYDTLKSTNCTAMLKISESWIRGYQILENRTHPEINMQGASGYVLTGIKCE
ncbi:tRNA (adenine(58)-N(1))-methyltransferase non-catalytic subunit TRM6-like [Varroa jacobsoni]|uniref:tRNA (adenine(58)-N(1))-methyltransferase non-catalytic subunit TRM6-like n=1 Tax=Varroa jacobsoni TaxID=62625 RepID=UPI000BF3BD90|nr:tRNA (adenine(58)-N(1))-methyltransferase non-catalytic subunit TRM6-like [Varroa jacobsoni]XP_022690343.1 tRNA (adenine(58)-N(1))-methyltransferase non-catalytic subunit TRM6-like [Varroa jacobsoni]